MKPTIAKKIISIAVTGVVVSSVTILCISTILMSGLLNRTVHDDIATMQSVILKTQKQEESRLLHNISIVSTMPEFVDAVYTQDTQNIKKLAQFFLRQLEIDSVAVTDADGIVLARGHSDQVGDSFSQRSTWIAARNGDIRAGILYDENAIIPYTIRCDAPILKDGAIVGVISLALDIGSEEYLDNMSEMTGLHFTLFKGDALFMTSIKDAGGNRTIDTNLGDSRIMDALLENDENVIERIEILNEPYMVAYWLIRDIEGEVLGMWAIAKPLTVQVRQTGNVLLIVISCSLVIMFVLVIVSGFFGKKITNPIRKVIDYAVNMADGNLDQPLNVKNRDEVGALAGALQTMVATLKKRMESIQDANDATQSANKAKSAFLTIMSHEMRTPLNVIIGLTDLHLEESELPLSVSDDIRKINKAGNILLSIVNDVLDISKIEAGKLELLPVQYNSASLLNDVITLNIIRIESKPIEFHVDISKDLPCEFFGDELRIKQVFNNLLSNAFKYTHRGTVTLCVDCERGDGDDIWMRISVSDTGIGIRQDDLKKLFSDYNQVDTKANRKIEGTGLGLSITKKLIELMGGSITVESEYGKGTAFRVRIMQKGVNDKLIGTETAESLRDFRYSDNKQEHAAKLVRADMSYAKVLVVDDVQTNLDVATGMMRKYKMHVDCLTSGQEAIDRVRSEEPVYDAIFMDHMMPVMDGIEAAKRIRAIGSPYAKNVVIISLTANAIAGNEQLFLESGFQAFLSKPINIMNLDTVLRRWVMDKSKEPPATEAPPKPESNKVLSIRGIDEKKGLALYAGDLELYTAILRSFAANTPTVINKLRHVTEETLPSYATNVHGLKGTSSSIGAENIRERAARLEAASKAGNITEVLAKKDALVKDADALVADIKEWLRKLDSGNAKPRLPAPDLVLLKNLWQCCEKFDMLGIDKAMDKLDSSSYEKGDRLVTLLRERIGISDFSAAVELIKKYEEQI